MNSFTDPYFAAHFSVLNSFIDLPSTDGRYKHKIKHNTEGHIKVISDLFLDSCGFGVIVPIVSAERLKVFFFAVRGILGKLGP